MTVLDASAVLAFLQGEPGADVVSEHLDGAVIGMDSFGASAPAEQLYAHFGISVDAVVAAVKSRA